jgi:hypothetical protein
VDTVGPYYKELARLYYEQALIDSVIIQDLKLKLKELSEERDKLKNRIDGGIRVEADLVYKGNPKLVAATNEDGSSYYNATLIIDEGITL